MSTRPSQTIINRLCAAVELLEGRSRKTIAAVQIPFGVDQKKVIERHTKLHPEDDGAETFVLFLTDTQNPDDVSKDKFSEAWRQIAYDEEKTAATDAVQIMRGNRMIAKHIADFQDNPTITTGREITGLCVMEAEKYGLDCEDVLQRLNKAGVPLYEPTVAGVIQKAGELGRRLITGQPRACVDGPPDVCFRR
jgi:hypothetical protein